MKLFLQLVFILSFNLSYSTHICAQDSPSDDGSVEPPQGKVEPPQENSVKIELSWSADLSKLAKNNSADESVWYELDTQQQLILKHFTKGNIVRGNVILIPTPSENADHPRIISPLAKQLSQLGWHVYIANLPTADYPKIPTEALAKKPVANGNSASDDQAEAAQETPSEIVDSTKKPNENLTTNSISKPAIKRHFFDNQQGYQDYFNRLLQSLIQKIQVSPGSLILVSNKYSSYWLLDKISKLPEIDQIVLIDPEIPVGDSPELDVVFKSQNKPVYSFFPLKANHSPFLNAFEQKNWPGNFNRLNKSTLSRHGIEMENTNISKKITGWSDQIQKDSSK